MTTKYWSISKILSILNIEFIVWVYKAVFSTINKQYFDLYFKNKTSVFFPNWK